MAGYRIKFRNVILLFPMVFASLGMVHAQELPLPVYSGESFTVPANYDTVWILKNSQYNRAIKIAMKQEIDSSSAALLEQKVILLNQIIAEQDSLITLNRQGYLHYRDLWQTTDLKLEEAEIKASHRWRWGTYGFYIGVGLSAIVFTSINR